MSIRAVRTIVILAVLAVGVIIALSPSLVYAPTPKIVLYFLLSLLPSILIGAEATSAFELKLPGFCFTTAGAFAVCLGVLVVLTYLSKPEEKIAVFQVYDETGQPVALDWEGALDVPVTATGLTVTKFVDRNTVVLIFPEQVGTVELHVKQLSTGPVYWGNVTYTGSRSSRITLGQQLTTAVQ